MRSGNENGKHELIVIQSAIVDTVSSFAFLFWQVPIQELEGKNPYHHE